VRGYKEEGTTTTPFDMTVLNDMDRFHLALDVIARVPRLRNHAAASAAADFFRARLVAHRAYVNEYGDDMPEIRDWRWTRLAAS
jgi:xylulose-5-phosphate/fructose-6-phosphate phosphoketolase